MVRNLAPIHSASVKSLVELESQARKVVVTGGRDGKIVVHDLRQKEASLQVGDEKIQI